MVDMHELRKACEGEDYREIDKLREEIEALKKTNKQLREELRKSFGFGEERLPRNIMEEINEAVPKPKKGLGSLVRFEEVEPNMDQCRDFLNTIAHVKRWRN